MQVTYRDDGQLLCGVLTYIEVRRVGLDYQRRACRAQASHTDRAEWEPCSRTEFLRVRDESWSRRDRAYAGL